MEKLSQIEHQKLQAVSPLAKSELLRRVLSKGREIEFGERRQIIIIMEFPMKGML